MGLNARGPRAAVAMLAGTLLTALATTAAANPALSPKLKSSSVLIIDPSDSSVLYSRNSDVAAPIASITKLMTALVVLDAKQPMGEPLEITQAETELPKTNFSRLTVGTVLTRGDMMHLALMSSENRAAHALGRNYPGGVPALVRAMNAKAARARHDQRAFRRPDRVVERERREPRGLVEAGDRRLAQSRPSANTPPIRAIRCACTGTWWSSTTPTTWWPIPPGTSSFRRRATSPRPASAW